MVGTKRKIKILIVEDEEDVRRFVANVLRNRNFLVNEASNGQEALAMISGNKLDIILLDGTMPVMDGFEVCRRLRENPKTRDIPIIFCSATHIAEAKERRIKVDDYLEKPFSVETLCKKIHRILKDKREQ